MQMRLQKALAQAGVASRRKAEELIVAGRVEVNGRRVTELGTQVDPDSDLIRVHGKLLESEEKVYFVLFKPTGVVTTLSDPQGRPTVRDFLGGIPQRVFAVGRLDFDAEGTLIITNDGELANKLMHPRYQVPRVYLAKVKGSPDAETLAMLRSGVRLEDGMVRPAEVEVGVKAERNTWLKLVLTEGRPHLIKRLCAAIGHPVVRLYRPMYGGISAEGLAPGEYRPLSPMEVAQLQQGGAAPIPSVQQIKPPPRHHRSEQDGFPDDRSEREAEPREDSEPRSERPERAPRAGGSPRPAGRGAGAGERAPAGRREERSYERAGAGRPAAGRRGFGGAAEGRSDRRPAARSGEGRGFGTAGEGRPAAGRRTFGKDASRNFGKPEGRSFGKPEGRSFGKPEGRSFGKPGEGRPAAGRRSFGGAAEGRSDRRPTGGRAEAGGFGRGGASRSEGRPEGKSFDKREVRRSAGGPGGFGKPAGGRSSGPRPGGGRAGARSSAPGRSGGKPGAARSGGPAGRGAPARKGRRS